MFIWCFKSKVTFAESGNQDKTVPNEFGFTLPTALLQSCNSLERALCWLLFTIIHLTLYQTTNFRLFQTERVCRRQFQIR